MRAATATSLRAIASLTSAWVATALLTMPLSAAADSAPPVDYMLHCMGCHRADGTGTPPGIPRLAGRVGYYLQVPEGRAYLVQVPGASQSLLDDAALATVLNWILAEFGGSSLPDGYRPYTAAEVSRYRHHAPTDVTVLRRRLRERLAHRTAGAVYP